MTLKLHFEDPEVLSFNDNDYFVINFTQPEEFMIGENGLNTIPGFVTQAYVPK